VLAADGARDEGTGIGAADGARDGGIGIGAADTDLDTGLGGRDGGRTIGSADTGLGRRDGSRMIGTGAGETWREAGGSKGGRVTLVVRDLDLGTKASGMGGCTDAVLEGGGVAIECKVGGGGGGGGGGMPDDAGINTSSFPFCFIISIICFTVNPMSCAKCMNV